MREQGREGEKFGGGKNKKIARQVSRGRRELEESDKWEKNMNTPHQFEL